MTNKGYKKLSYLLSSHINHPIETDFQEPIVDSIEGKDFWEIFVRYADAIDLAIVRNKGTINQLTSHLEKSITPFIAECNLDGSVVPVIFCADDRGKVVATALDVLGQESDINLTIALDHLVRNDDGEVEYAVPISNNPMISDEKTKKKNSSIARLYRLLSAEKKDIGYIYLYALLISLFGLVLPLGVQTVIELIAGGVVIDSISVMIGLVIVVTMFTGGLQIMQLKVVETLQRRVFVKAAFEFAFRLPKIKLESLLGSYAPELMNRFFDVLTIQKSLPKFLIDLSGAILQILFGMMLLSFYHPLFIVFGMVLISMLIILFYITGPKALDANMVESKYKYKVVHWLEEMARTLLSFKIAGNTSLPVERTENLTNHYLYYRNKQFGVVINQFLYVYIFKTLVTGGLLIIGSWLVINREINLGQFVASEIVIVLVLSASEKLVLSMEVAYDMLTAVDKIAHVTDLPLERKGGVLLNPNLKKGLTVKMKDLHYTFPNGTKVLNGVNIDIKSGERICLAGYNSSGKDTMILALGSFLNNYKGGISYDNHSLRDVDLLSLRSDISKNLSDEELFDGSILENITMGRDNISYEDIIWALKSVELLDFVEKQPQGLKTVIAAGGKVFSESVVIRFILARCIVDHPRLLILNRTFQELESHVRMKILTFLTDKNNPWTLIFVGNDPILSTLSDRVAIMSAGKVEAIGTVDELRDQDSFKQCFLTTSFNA
ncbi:peptidase domain-containing ABC transporter [Flammeovirga kamogawensis]|uniref:ABC transporter ATP-binding protein/permease n=1 Tax=Flammeovirga kamogawensis TaxID=373891 RepID=A0ABX8H4E1_9BACT|nr:ABC transporter ATP-binding protein [Flammeovirga kamogawensis]MBB6460401.1 ABC-type bacteriocin/lantibiotic exporter with double-glycine peptidase domain [Flammeovirga kamogawensis]QWG10207.1 ABC transporter ATP-binding protein/permease [Flammeovirga kamogawensis]TRX64659.1 ABC transporter ATP-binding protein [Flammeovirga kamogawensis]